MKISEIATILDAEIVTGADNADVDIVAACGSDLMSDVMAYVNDNVLLLTGLVNLQVIRTAEIMDIQAVVFVRGKKLDSDIIELARDKGITIMTTKHSMFTACGKLYSEGIEGKGARE